MLKGMTIVPMALSAMRYTPVGDIIVTGLSFLLFVLLMQTHIHKDHNFRVLVAMMGLAVVSAYTNIIYQMLLITQPVHAALIYIFRFLHHAALFGLMFCSVHYLQEPLWIRQESRRLFNSLASMLIVLALLLDILGSMLHITFYIDESGAVHSNINIFIILYALILIVQFYMIIHYKGRIIRQIYHGLLASNIIGYAIMAIQGIFHQSSFTTMAYFFPVIGLAFMFHANPFDIQTGAATDTYLYHSLKYAQEHKKPLGIISCTIANFTRLLAESKDIRLEYYDFFRQNVRKGVLYRLENDRLVLTFPIPEDQDLRENKQITRMLENFLESYRRFEMDYQIVVMRTSSDIAAGSDYIRLMEEAERVMPINSVHYIDSKDMERFYGNSYILTELKDIVSKKDLDDERVLVYCQPVFNINTGTYDTAEALMRLKLPKVGMVYPDQFIPVAEQAGCIHTLSLIILNKTCGAIRTMLEAGVDMQRISVNFSTLDIRYDSFCKEVQQIIARNQIPYHKIAIEITESRSEADFNIMKSKVQELQKLGIKFYLDDFGTGYSNFERIMEIPFDIIKFDRSMTMESAKNETFFYMVSTFANMFSELHYAVLFEGIEDDNDEKNCVKMSAKYLQGYKYSKPIPIEELPKFLVAKAS